MIDTVPRSAVGRLLITRGVQAVLRATIVVTPMVAFAATTAASGSTAGIVGVLLAVLAVECAMSPESHLGLLVTAVVGLHWLLAVEDVMSPWSLVAGLALGALHLSMAAASVAPPAASWTRAMTRRWAGRALVTAGVVFATFVVVQATGERRFDGTAVILMAALVWLTLAGAWLRSVAVGRPDS